MALPLSDPLVRLNIPESELNNLVLCLKKTLVQLNVANVESFSYTENTMLDV